LIANRVLMSLKTLSKIEFQTIVLIYAGHADYDYTEEEVRCIKKYSSEEIYERMYQYFQTKSDYEILKLILRYKQKYCSTPDQKKLLYNKINKLFLSDGDYSRSEKVFLAFLDKMIATQNELKTQK